MRILISGSLFYDDQPVVFITLQAIATNSGGEEITLVHDGQMGAQLIASQIAEANPDFGFVDEPHPGVRDDRLIAMGADRCLVFVQTSQPHLPARAFERRALEAGIRTTVYSD